MKARQAYEKIVEITGGSCFGREGLIDDQTIGLDGRFTLEQLEEIIKVMKEIE